LRVFQCVDDDAKKSCWQNAGNQTEPPGINKYYVIYISASNYTWEDI
jgi:hypothetical protein